MTIYRSSNDRPMPAGTIARVSEFCGIMDFRNRLIVVEFHGEAGVTCVLLANRARRARIPSALTMPIETLNDQEMALLTDEELASLAAYRMGV